MRRIWAAGAATLFCLTLGVSPALAQEDSQEDPEGPASGMVFVTGNESCGVRAPWEPFSAAINITSVRDARARCVNVMSDPRLSGSWVNVLNMDCYGDDEFCVLWGTHVLEKAEGGWDCTWTASNFPTASDVPTAEEDADAERPFLIIGVCPGTGGYEGLSYVFQHTDAKFPGNTSFQGVIYEGPPPGYGVAAAAE